MTDPRVHNLARIMVAYSSNVKSNDLVCIQSGMEAAPLVREIYRMCIDRGAHVKVQATLDGLSEIFFDIANQKQLTYIWPDDELITRKVDVLFKILSDTNTRSLTHADPGKQAIAGKARAKLMNIFMQRSAKKALRWTLTLYPTKAYAQDAEMSLERFENFVYHACFADKRDPIKAWRDLSKRQEKLKRRLSRAKVIRILAPGTDLRIGVAKRTWINCNGRYNLPDGEVFTGPLENATEGHVYFNIPACHHGRKVSGVRLTFQKGRVVEASAEQNEAYLLQMLDMDKGSRILGEFAVACNYQIQRPTGEILFDEKIGGSVHMALGAAYPETGGKNKSSLHWDMICDLRDGGKMLADGEAVMVKGRLKI